MALTGAKFQEATLGQYGSIFVDAAGIILPPSGYIICAISFLTDSTFHSDDGLIPENNVSESAVFIKTATTTAAASVTVANAAGSHAANAGEEGSGGEFIDSSNVFPKGMTIFGRWAELKNATGSFIAYLAPKH